MNTNFEVIALTRFVIKPELAAPEADAFTPRQSEMSRGPRLRSLLINIQNQSVGVVVKHILGSIPGPVKSDFVARDSPVATAATFPCCPGAKQQRWAPPLITRFGVITRVQ